MKLINFLATDGVQLNCLLYESANSTKKVILAVHGMTSNCFKKRDEIISQEANKNNIDYFCFNNRGSELAKYIRKEVNDKIEKSLGGMSYDEARDALSYYGIYIKTTSPVSDSARQSVISQGVSPGTWLSHGSVVEVALYNDDESMLGRY